MRKGSENWNCSSWMKLRRDLTNVYKYIQGGSQVDGARFFKQCPATEQDAVGTNRNTGICRHGTAGRSVCAAGRAAFIKQRRKAMKAVKCMVVSPSLFVNNLTNREEASCKK